MVMTEIAPWWLLQQVATLPDTLLMKQVGAEAGTFQRITTIASGLMTIAILVLTVALVPAAWNFRKSYGKINDLVDKVYADINPITHHVSRISDNIDYITTAMRADVERVNETVRDANDRLAQVVRLAELRMRQLDGLLSVVQEEAEATFVSAAATVRGVRTGTAVLRDEAYDDLVGQQRLAFDDYDADGPDSELDDHSSEVLDGYDGEGSAGGRPERPRVRPRRGGGWG
jgi:uncharacterized protein YoxC